MLHMRWPFRGVRWSPNTPVFLLSLIVLWPRVALAQLPAGWTSTDVGSVGVAGSATESNGAWTVQGSGADIWGTSDSFQFVHKTMGDSGRVEARISDLQNTNPFAKVGVMVRSGLGPDAATVYLGVRPGSSTSGGDLGGLEFMVRSQAGVAMVFLSGSDGSARPISLRLTWQGNRVLAQFQVRDEFQTGIFSTIGAVDMAMPTTTEAGLAVTSHDQTQLTTAHVTGLAASPVPPPGWHSSDVGDVGQAGSAVETNGVWTINGAGGDIWGTADSFRYLWRGVSGQGPQLNVRIDDLKNTHPFGKAGLMVRQTLDPDSPAIVLDVTPSGNVEFMVRDTKGGEMTYVGGTTVTFPVWLRLDNARVGLGTDYAAAVSQDGVHFTGLLTRSVGGPANSVTAYYVGVAVTGHDTSQLTTAHVRGMSIGYQPIQIGDTGLIGNAAVDPVAVTTVEAEGADIWGSADSFQLLNEGGSNVLAIRVLGIAATHPFAKTGLVFRDGTDPNAASVILDITPSGNVEFMARLCGGCETTYLGGATMTFPAYLLLSPGTPDAPSTFTAKVSQTRLFRSSTTDPLPTPTTIGTVTVPMSNRIGGVAVTSHDPSQVTTVTFDNGFVF
jgi:hypothetical protein